MDCKDKENQKKKKALFGKHILGGSIVIFGIKTAVVFWYWDCYVYIKWVIMLILFIFNFFVGV